MKTVIVINKRKKKIRKMNQIARGKKINKGKIMIMES